MSIHSAPPSPERVSAFLDQIASPDPQIRLTAWQFAGRMGAPVVAGLADRAASEDKGVAKAARGALEKIVHYAARPGASDEARAMSAELLKVVQSNRPRAVRADALHLLGFVAGKDALPMLARLQSDSQVGEEARMARERIAKSVGSQE